jgi:hypothetical protein
VRIISDKVVGAPYERSEEEVNIVGWMFAREL